MFSGATSLFFFFYVLPPSFLEILTSRAAKSGCPHPPPHPSPPPPRGHSVKRPHVAGHLCYKTANKWGEKKTDEKRRVLFTHPLDQSKRCPAAVGGAFGKVSLKRPASPPGEFPAIDLSARRSSRAKSMATAARTSDMVNWEVFGTPGLPGRPSWVGTKRPRVSSFSDERRLPASGRILFLLSSSSSSFEPCS